MMPFGRRPCVTRLGVKLVSFMLKDWLGISRGISSSYILAPVVVFYFLLTWAVCLKSFHRCDRNCGCLGVMLVAQTR